MSQPLTALNWLQKISDMCSYIEASSFYRFIYSLYKWRYVLYCLITVGLYQIFIAPLFIPLSLLISPQNIALLNNALFCTIGLVPFWFWAFVTVDNAIQRWLVHLRAPYDQVCSEASLMLERIEQRIENDLSQSITDVATFDIEGWSITLHDLMASLDQQQILLTERPFYESWFLTDQMLSHKADLLKEIALLKEKLKTAPQKMVDIITLGVKKAITLTTAADTVRDYVKPLLSQAQLEKHRTFVRKHATFKMLLGFEQAVDVVSLWLDRLDKLSIESENCENHASAQKHLGGNPDASAWKYPWGNASVDEPAIRGWDAILKCYPDDYVQRYEAAIAINALLLGRSSISKQDFISHIEALDLGENKGAVIQKIQQHLYHTLSRKCPQNAAFFSKAQKQTVKEWFEANQKDIKNAQTTLDQLMLENVAQNMPAHHQKSKAAEISQAQLSRFFYVLEGAQIYDAALGLTLTTARHRNSVQAFLASYVGDSDMAYKLLRFVPESEHNTWLVQVGRKRLAWILEAEQHKTEQDKSDGSANTGENAAANKPILSLYDRLLFNRYQCLEDDKKINVLALINEKKQGFNYAK